MSVLVDTPRYPAHGRWWAHLASDTSTEELHAFAAALGLPRRSFEGDHYDVPADLVERAVAAGAQRVSTRELLARLRAAGLRTPKRRGEKVLASAPTAGGGRVDVVRADAVPAPHAGHRLLVLEGERVLLAADGDLPALPAPRGRALGFRRRWRRTATGTAVTHEGLWQDTGAPAPAVGRWAAVPAGAWWVPLLP
ncbi:DUF4031 domain-containing protein [Kineococcus sp. SYSU DK006]|uniref:DUF4031 domain-containing protein n=1 Tax=Kineococcus sp. SYSU DK006 TaxID=3383127 RepID=UPI003D7C6D2F